MRTFSYTKKAPKVEEVDCSQRIWPVERLAYDENHQLVIIQDGSRDVQAEIEANASRVVSLAEVCAGLPGSSPLEKLNYALENGILPSSSEGSGVSDFTVIPSNIADLANTGNEARAMLGGQKGNLEDLINTLVKQALEQQKAAAEAPADEKGEK